MIAVGLGTGRCGTRSLTKFFKENGVDAVHEQYRLPWIPDYEEAENALENLKGRSSVAFYWLNYVDWLRVRCPGVKFVCLKREREKVVRSFNKGFGCSIINSKVLPPVEMRLSKLYDRSILDTVDASTREWMETSWDDEWDADGVGVCLPDYDVHDKRTYVERYWDDYYTVAEQHVGDDFIIIDLEYGLNTDEGRREILTHIGVDCC